MQSSVSLQHLPVDAAAEAGNLPPALLGRLSFATQKLGEIVRAARAAGADGFGSDVGPELFAPCAVSDDEPRSCATAYRRRLPADNMHGASINSGWFQLSRACRVSAASGKHESRKAPHLGRCVSGSSCRLARTDSS